MNDLPKNPYTEHRGFNQRVRIAENKLRDASVRQMRELFDRDFDDCFECGDGDAVVFQLMHTARVEEVDRLAARDAVASGGHIDLDLVLGHMC